MKRFSRLFCPAALYLGLQIPALAYPTYTQEHFIWRNDDGSESAASSRAGADVNTTNVHRNTNIRLRFSICSTNAVTYWTPLYAPLEYATSTNPGAWTAVSAATNGTSFFEMAPSPNFANGDPTTPLLSGSASWLTGEMIEYPANASSNITFTNSRYSNLEYCFRPTDKTLSGSNYFFRIGGLSEYRQMARLTIEQTAPTSAPSFLCQLTAAATAGCQFTNVLAAAGAEPISYSAANLPSGLTFNGTNTITGAPQASGDFTVDITASNIYGTTTRQLVISVAGNHPPSPSYSSSTLYANTRTTLNLSASDPDPGQSLSYHLVTPPSHGTLESSTNQAWYYTAQQGYSGPDSFTWRAFDGIDYSASATFNLNVISNRPAPQAQSASVQSNSTTVFPAKFTGGGGYSYVIDILTNAAHANVVVTNGTSFQCTAALNYTGGDSFSWRMRYGPASGSLTGTTATVVCSLTIKDISSDWPQWFGDEFRSGTTSLDLPTPLYLQWRRDCPPLSNSWQSAYLKYDGAYQLVSSGAKLFVAACGNGGNDSVTALSTTNGLELWRFYANAPIRVAPAAAGGRVFVCSDDGCLYCLSAQDGTVLWKLRGGPAERRIFGNERLISAWPSRSGLLLNAGKVYFTAGLWPQEGTFVYCLDAATGSVVWKNDSASGLVANMPHDNGTVIPAGITPQGYPALSADGNWLRLAVCRATPPVFNRATGAIVSYTQGVAYQNTSTYGGWWVNSSGNPSYTAPVSITAGSRTWTSTDVASLGVAGTAKQIIAADDRLFAVSAGGSIYCFGGTATTPSIYPLTTNQLPAVSDSWTAMAARILSVTTNTEGCCYVLGLGTGRLAEELVKQTTLLHVIAVDPDPVKVAAFRDKMNAAGLYGTRCCAVLANPLDAGLPPYTGRLIVSEDASVAGLASGATFVKTFFRVTRPYGGTMWLTTSDPEHATLSGLVAAASLTNAVLSRVDGIYSRLNRNGALPGAANCLGAEGVSGDTAVKAPLGMQWFGDKYTWGVGHGDNTRPDIYNGKMRAPALTLDIYTGLPLTFEGRTGGGSLGADTFGIRTNPFYLAAETRTIYSGYGCGTPSASYGSLATMRSGAAGFYDLQSDIGTVHLSAVRPGCNGSTSIAPGNGVLLVGGAGCYCDYPLTPSTMVMTSLPEVENWGMYSTERSTRGLESEPVQRIGCNFGAPGDRKDADGTMWLHRPQRASVTMPFQITYTGTNVTYTYHHSSRVSDTNDKPWVAASCLKGVTNVTIGLTPEKVVTRTCSTAPVLDGYLTDSCWDGQNLVNMVGGNAFVYLRHDSTNLYIACRRTAATPVNWVEFADAPAYWRVLLSDSSRQWTRYINLCVTAGGVRSQSMKNTNDWFAVEDSSWNGVWYSGCRGGTASTEFNAEFSIPWATVTAAGLDTNNLVADFCCQGYPNQGQARLRKFWNATSHDRWARVGFDAGYGRMASPRKYTAKLYFAETEGANAGERVFDIKLQGQTVLSGFDIIQEAGAANTAVVKTFKDITADESMVVDLVASAGTPLLSGIELINGNPWNTPPVAQSISAATAPGVPLDMTLAATDMEGSNLTYTVLTPPGHGALSGTPPALTYTPAAGYHGLDSFTYKASDGVNDSGAATVTVTVNTPPLPAGQTQTTPEDVPKSITLAGMDPDGDPFTFTCIQPVHGSVTGSGTDVTYTPPACWHGTDTFAFVMTDSYQGTATGTVSMTVTHTNHAPLATGQCVTTTTNTSRSITLQGNDPDGDAMTFAVTAQPSHGSVSGVPPSVTYTPATGFSGSDSFSFTASDGQLTSAQATVTVSVVAGPGPQRMKITFGGYTNRTETLSNFPVLVVLSNNVGGSGFDWATRPFSSSNGWDLRFKTDLTATGTNTLSYEIDSWDTGNVACIWVKVPVLPPNGTGSIWATWHDNADTNQLPCTTNGSTWADGYRSVYHFSPVNGAAGMDSSTNQCDATSNETTCAPAGRIGYAANFNGAQRMDLAPSSRYLPAVNSKIAVGLWFNPSVIAAGDLLNRMLSVGQPSTGSSAFLMSLGAAGRNQFFCNEGTARYVTNLPGGYVAAGAWSHMAVMFNGSQWWVMLNGMVQTNWTGGLTNGSAVAAARLGCGMGDTPGAFFSGMMDEVQISGVTRSTNWMWASYMNQGSNLAFNTYDTVTANADQGNVDSYGIPDSWKLAYFGTLSGTNTDALSDWDGDGMCNYAEWKAGTDPSSTNSLLFCSVPGAGAAPPSSTNIVIVWPSAAGRLYAIKRSTNLTAGFTDTLATGVTATPPTNSYTAGTGQSPQGFFKITVE